MIEWGVFVSLFVFASVATYLFVPLEHRQNYQRCAKDRTFWLANLFAHLTWLVAGVQNVVALGDFPKPVRILGVAFIVTGSALCIWAWRTNFFLLPVVVYIPVDYRATTGPYAVCDHPFYLGNALTACGTFFLLGQSWAFWPTLAYLILLIYRIRIEEKILSKKPQ